MIRQQESTSKKRSSKSKKKFKKREKDDISLAYGGKRAYNPEFLSLKKKKKSRDRSAYSNKSLKKRKSNNALFNNLPLSFVKTLGTPKQRFGNIRAKTPKAQLSTSVWVKKSRKKRKMKRTNSYQKEGFNRRGVIKDRTGGYIGIGSLKYKGIKPKKISKIFDGIIESKAFQTFTPGNYGSDAGKGFERNSKSRKKRDFSSGGTPNSNASFHMNRSKERRRGKKKEKSRTFNSKLELNSKFLSKMKKKNQKVGDLGKITMKVSFFLGLFLSVFFLLLIFFKRNLGKKIDKSTSPGKRKSLNSKIKKKITSSKRMQKLKKMLNFSDEQKVKQLMELKIMKESGSGWRPV